MLKISQSVISNSTNHNFTNFLQRPIPSVPKLRGNSAVESSWTKPSVSMTSNSSKSINSNSTAQIPMNRRTLKPIIIYNDISTAPGHVKMNGASNLTVCQQIQTKGSSIPASETHLVSNTSGDKSEPLEPFITKHSTNPTDSDSINRLADALFD